ncbi:MAG: PAS domain S-box-containing protein [Kiritimatiellia bacterium]|jgi:PAS domain S-box-containing protein
MNTTPDGEPLSPGRRGLGRILMFSHLRVALVGVLILLVGLVATIHMRNVARELVDQGQPRNQAISDCRMGLQKALASLRGWIAVEDDRFRRDRRHAWDGQIYPALARLEALYGEDAVSELAALKSVRRTMQELEEWQWYIEDVAHSPGNHPVRFMFNEQVSPVFDDLAMRISLLIEMEAAESDGANNRILLLKKMADFRGQLSRSQHAFQRYSEDFESIYLTQVLDYRREAMQALAEINASERLISQDQLGQLGLLNDQVQEYLSLSEDLFDRAVDAESNAADSWLGRECVPRARDVLIQLDEIAAWENARMLHLASAVNRISRLAPIVFSALLVLMMGTAYLTSRRGADRVTGRVGTLVAASREVAAGRMQRDIPVEGQDELSLLAESFNRMRASLVDREKALQHKEQESRLIIETASDGIVIINEVGQIELFNPAAETLFGYRADEVVGQNVNMLMPAPHAEAHDGYLKHYLETGEKKIIGIGREVQALHKDGHPFSVHLAISEMEVMGKKYFSGIITDLTEMIRIKHDLDMEKERFNLAIQGSSDGIWDWDVASNVVFFSPRFKALLGYEDHEIKHDFGEFESRLHPDDKEETMEAVTRHLRDREPYDVEYRLLRKSGKYAWFQARGQAIWNAEGLPVRMAGSLTDVSKRKEAEAAQEGLNQHLEAQNRLQARLVRLNNCMRGERNLEALGKNLLSHLVEVTESQLGALYVVDDNDTQVLQRLSTHALDASSASSSRIQLGEGLVGQAAADGKRVELSELPADYFHLQSGAGSMRPAYVLISPLLHDDRVSAVLELAASAPFSEEIQRFLRAGAEQVAIGLAGAQLNQRMEHLLSQTRQQSKELIDQGEEMKSINEELEDQARALQISQRTLQNQQEELQVINEELEEQKEALQVKNRLVEQANINLKKKADELAEASRYKSEFLANMSHELRTPLNSLLILSHLLGTNKEGNLHSKQVEYAQTIHKSGSDLLTLINDILDLSKVEAGRLDVQWSTCSFRELVAQLMRQFEHVAADRRLGFHTRLDESLPESFTTDPQRLEQILRNLSSNAFKFTSKGSVTVEIGRPSADEVAALRRLKLSTDAVVAFRVRDTGIGVPLDKQQVIFESFQQVDGSISRKYGGTGLGLSISREFAQLLGGEIHLESLPEQGSCFKLFLPERPDQMAPAATPGGSVPKIILDPPSHTGPSNSNTIHDDLETIAPGDAMILIIEDDVDFANVLGELSHEKGFKRLIACDGLTGLHYAFTYRPNAILLDVNLPELDGVTLLSRLKANPDTKEIPVHFITGRDDMDDFRKHGAVGLLKKPVSTEALLEAIETARGYTRETAKQVLVVAGDPANRQAVVDLISPAVVASGAVKQVATVEEAEALLADARFDCLILDLEQDEVPPAMQHLERMRDEETTSHPPVIIYVKEMLDAADEARLQQHGDRVVLKGERSPERLLDEVTLFLADLRTQLSAHQQEVLRNQQVKQAGLGGKSILIVDDDLRNAFALNSMLEEQGLQVHIKKNGQEALDMLAGDVHIDLVLMDIMMPVMDGYEAMKAIRRQPHLRSLPIIALTAKAMIDDRERCLEAGADDYLAKPVDVDRLLSLIHVWVQQGGDK